MFCLLYNIRSFDSLKFLCFRFIFKRIIFYYFLCVLLVFCVFSLYSCYEFGDGVSFCVGSGLGCCMWSWFLVGDGVGYWGWFLSLGFRGFVFYFFGDKGWVRW